MKVNEAVKLFSDHHRVVLVKYNAHAYRLVTNKAGKAVGVVIRYECQCWDGKAPSIEAWCPRAVVDCETAKRECPVQFHAGDVLCVEFDLWSPDRFATNGNTVRATGVSRIEG